jgi:RNA polymerase sigma-70 factor (ECF subfamily)
LCLDSNTDSRRPCCAVCPDRLSRARPFRPKLGLTLLEVQGENDRTGARSYLKKLQRSGKIPGRIRPVQVLVTCGVCDLANLPRSRSSVHQTTLQQAIRGDRYATERLLVQHFDQLETRLAGLVPKSLQPVLPVEDLLQDTFVHAIRSLPRCRATTSESFAAWLDTIAKNRVIDAVRRIKSQKRNGGWQTSAVSSSWSVVVEWCQEDSTPGRLAARHEAQARIASAIGRLPPDERDAMRLRYLQGASLAETADGVRRSPAAARGLLHRARRRLRDIMQSSSRWFDGK